MKTSSLFLFAAALVCALPLSAAADEEPSLVEKAAKKRALSEEYLAEGYAAVDCNLLAEAKLMNAGINVASLIKDKEISENERRLLQRIVGLNDDVVKQDGYAKTCDAKLKALERQIADEEISAAEAAEKADALTKEAREITEKRNELKRKRDLSIRQVNGELAKGE